MGDQLEPLPENSRNIVPENICHKHISILPIRHVHRMRYIFNNIKVGVKKFDTSIKLINFKLLPLLPRSFLEKNFVYQLKVSILHNLYNPFQRKFDLRSLLLACSLHIMIITSNLSLWYLALTVCNAQLQRSMYWITFSSVILADCLKMSLNVILTII